ncbi:glycosyltransferase family 2 protein [Aestuariibacter sp. GS-14]|uniref:glycosyltransferase family 2 protein n=1 Tax=Aestuariibacter sp. GS-14 TaxID=2590670 RepID=UPI001128B516|nr:glycosyltransferase family 2 protein [Aestuariibacter sp. GS-14]TPV62113.1 glycosyltransferase family 2 protein [Aestuariibacter sp. GS-14]
MQALKQKYWQLESFLTEKKIKYQSLNPAKQRHSLENSLTVSLTSYPPRFNTLYLTLKTLVNQSIRPDRLVLWVAAQDEIYLPTEIVKLQDKVEFFEIRTCTDTRSYKKLVPSLLNWPDDIIVTADDDVSYPSDWLAGLISGFTKTKSITAYRAHCPTIVEGKLGLYATWLSNKNVSEGIVFPTGIGGVLYPPNCFLPEVTDSSLFMNLAPTADDVWFFFCSRLNGKNATLTESSFNIINWRSTNESGLAKINVSEGHNDLCIRNVTEYFGDDLVMKNLVGQAQK